MFIWQKSNVSNRGFSVHFTFMLNMSSTFNLNFKLASILNSPEINVCHSEMDFNCLVQQKLMQQIHFVHY